MNPLGNITSFLNTHGKSLAYGLGGAGLLAGGLAGFVTHTSRKDRRGEAAFQADVMKAGLGAGALALGLGGVMLRKQISYGLGRALGSNNLISGIGKNVVAAGVQLGESAKSVEKHMLRPILTGTKGLDFWDSYFPNARGVTRDNLVDSMFGANRAKYASNKAFDKQVQKIMTKQGLSQADAAAHYLDDLNSNPFQRLRLRGSMTKYVVGAGIVGTAGSYYDGLYPKSNLGPTTFYDGVSMRHVNDQGVNQDYANSVRGMEAQEIMQAIGRTL